MIVFYVSEIVLLIVRRTWLKEAAPFMPLGLSGRKMVEIASLPETVLRRDKSVEQPCGGGEPGSDERIRGAEQVKQDEMVDGRDHRCTRPEATF